MFLKFKIRETLVIYIVDLVFHKQIIWVSPKIPFSDFLGAALPKGFGG